MSGWTVGTREFGDTYGNEWICAGGLSFRNDSILMSEIVAFVIPGGSS